MLRAPFTNALVLTGPTASGKTDLGLELAQRLGAEIVAMDSMTLYRGIDIATAKPSREQQQRVPHHLIDVLQPWQSASVAWWLDRAAACCRDIESRGKQVLFVGGTPLYLKAMLAGLFEGPPADVNLRQGLEAEAAEAGSAHLHRRLAEVDARSAARIHANDLRRIVRALEVHILTGRPISAWQSQWAEERRPDDGMQSVLWLDVPRAELYARIDRRVAAMFAAGLVDEVRTLRALDQPLSREAAQALGYKEVLHLLDGKASRKDTLVQIQTRTRNFAKRQITWFRHLPGCRAATKELTWGVWQSKMI
jgi:tRNA dimethylallyltransferase